MSSLISKESMNSLIDGKFDVVLGLSKSSFFLQKLIFSKLFWKSTNNSKNKILSALYEIYEDIDWKAEKIFDIPAWRFVNNLNNSIHSEEKTTGGKRFRESVIRRQKGEFCVLCGKKDKKTLQVDHVDAVNQGGGENDVRNMQILCKPCNVGKSNKTEFDIVEEMMLADTPKSLALRYKVFLRNKNINHELSTCAFCGSKSRDVELDVVKINSKLAYCYSNLTVRCKKECL